MKETLPVKVANEGITADQKLALQLLEDYGQKISAGKATAADFVEMMERMPAKERALLESEPAFSSKVVSIKKQWLAMEANLRAGLKDQTLLGRFARMLKVPLADLVNIPHEVFGAVRMAAESASSPSSDVLKKFDTWLFAHLKFKESRAKLPDRLADRCIIAIRMNDHAFFISLGEALKEGPLLSQGFLVGDLQLKRFQIFLVENWEVIKGWTPHLGLREFSESALADYVSLRVESDTTTEAIKKARKRLGLKLAPVKTVISMGTRRTSKGELSQVTFFTKGGQTLVHRVSRPSS
jgi:hypothetical protein